MQHLESGTKVIIWCVLSACLVMAQPAAAPRQPGSAQPVVRVTTRLIQVNVVAQDRHANPVTDLTKDDFVLKDAGKEQKIAIFAMEHSGAAASPAAEGLPANTFTNRIDHRTGAVTVILFDLLNTKLPDSMRAKAQLVNYIQQMSAGDQAAIYVLGRELILVHDFSRSPEALIQAVNGNKIKANHTAAEDADPAGSDTGNEDLDAAIDSGRHKLADFLNERRAETTLESLQFIAQHVSRIPGRKNLVWISGGFPFSMNQEMVNLDRDSRDFNEETQKMARFLNDANMAIYPIDVRGLIQNAIPDASAPGRSRTLRLPQPKGDPPYDTFDIVAERTGGKAYHNTNDLTGAIKRAVDDAKVSYVIGFYPAEAKWDGQFHQLKLECKRHGVNIRYRPGYFATSAAPEQTTRRYTTVQQAIQAKVNLDELGFTVQLTPRDTDLVAKVVIDPNGITMTQQDDNWVGTLQFEAIGGSTENGQFDDPRPLLIKMNLEPAAHETVLQNGFTITHTFHVTPATNQFRIAVQDVPSGAIGSLVLTIRHPPQAPATSPQAQDAK